MADLPDLIIRTAEERRAEFPYLLSEAPTSYGVRMREVHNEHEEGFLPKCPRGKERKIWRFKEREALHLFAESLVRNYRNTGVNATRSLSSEHEHCYDSRSPWSAPAHIATSVTLEW